MTSRASKSCSARCRAAGSCLIVVEATGAYHRRLVTDLVDAGHQVAVVNPRQARDFAHGLGMSPKPIH